MKAAHAFAAEVPWRMAVPAGDMLMSALAMRACIVRPVRNICSPSVIHGFAIANGVGAGLTLASGDVCRGGSSVFGW